MTLKNAARALVTTLVVALSWTLTQTPATATAAPAETAAAVVLTYDASGAEEFVDAVDSGAAVWNETVANVRLEPAAPGAGANIEIVADDGWPRALTTSLGNGIVWMGRQAVNEGYDTVRIAAHELGHILGLPDIKPGPCSSLMSGSTAGTACTNPYPNAAERAAVEDNFASGAAAWTHGPRLYRD
ncbi:snapalysin family zinc-dependent metalloprotease [Streptomyces sp. 4N509B]|uniref:snapalysin family zinc-dependent metalloprotease n=1 Tax=Streptomyces sp. 4N509B TaxID=3457413 RepID=UPI003FCF9F7D